MTEDATSGLRRPLDENLARFFSSLLNPVVIPIPLFWAIARVYTNSLPVMLKWVGIGVGFTSIATILITVVFRLLGIVSDSDYTRHHERKLPFYIICCFYLAGSLLMWSLDAPPPLLAIMTCYFLVTFAGAAVTLLWKISMHLAGISGPAVAVIYFLGLKFAPLLALIPLLGWARLRLQRHTLAQVVAGALMSILITTAVIAAM